MYLALFHFIIILFRKIGKSLFVEDTPLGKRKENDGGKVMSIGLYRRRPAFLIAALVLVLAAGSFGSLFSAENSMKENGMQTKNMGKVLEVPEMDKNVPAVMETATFALG
jgi:hypothetical protein